MSEEKGVVVRGGKELIKYALTAAAQAPSHLGCTPRPIKKLATDDPTRQAGKGPMLRPPVGREISLCSFHAPPAHVADTNFSSTMSFSWLVRPPTLGSPEECKRAQTSHILPIVPPRNHRAPTHHNLPITGKKAELRVWSSMS